MERLRRLRENEDFNELSLEALIYEAIKGTDADEVQDALTYLVEGQYEMIKTRYDV